MLLSFKVTGQALAVRVTGNLNVRLGLGLNGVGSAATMEPEPRLLKGIGDAERFFLVRVRVIMPW